MHSHHDHVDTIISVIDRLRKTKFSFLEEEDIAQEAYLIAMKVIVKWDGVRSLENFLMTALSRRLISLSRAYYRNEAKRLVTDTVGPIDLPIVPPDGVEAIDLVDYVLDNLPVGMRTDYVRWANGVTIPSSRREALVAKVKEICDEEA